MGLVGAEWMLSSCGPAIPVFKTTMEEKELVVSKDKFPPQQNLLLVRSPAFATDILLVRRNNQFKALLMECTHEYTALTATNTRIVCSLHGSTFDFDGNVVKEPALNPLKQFRVREEANNLIIQLS